MENEEVVFSLTAMITDEIGDRLYSGDDQVGQAIEWRHTDHNVAEFWFLDGRHAVVTVAVDGDA